MNFNLDENAACIIYQSLVRRGACVVTALGWSTSRMFRSSSTCVTTCLLYLFASLLTPARSELILDEKISGKQLSFHTSEWKHFGPHGSRSVYEAPAVLMAGNALCAPEASMVAGKVIFFDILGSDLMVCDFTVFTMKLHDAGALAIVYIVKQKDPGMLYNVHPDWDKDSMRGRTVASFSISKFEISTEMMNSWLSKSGPAVDIGVVRKIDAPYVNKFEELYTSPQWLMVIQICAPWFALLTALKALAEIHLRVQSGEYGDFVGIVVCAIELPCMVVIAIIMAGGHHGPMYLPYGIHTCLSFLLSGWSIFTTVLVSMKLREMARCVQSFQGASNKTVWGHYRWTITASFIVFVLIGDMGAGFLISTFTEIAPPMLAALFIAFSIFQLCAVLFFTIQAWGLAKPLITYLRHPQSNVRPLDEERVGTFVKWISISSVSMLVNTLSSGAFLIGIIYGAMQPVPMTVVFVTVTFCVFSRIMVSFSQVMNCASFSASGRTNGV